MFEIASSTPRRLFQYDKSFIIPTASEEDELDCVYYSAAVLFEGEPISESKVLQECSPDISADRVHEILQKLVADNRLSKEGENYVVPEYTALWKWWHEASLSASEPEALPVGDKDEEDIPF